MVAFIAGAAAGLIYMLVFVAVAPVMVFSVARHTESRAGGFVRRVNPTTLMLGLVVAAYPVWTLFGGMLGLLYKLSTQVTPGPGTGVGELDVYADAGTCDDAYCRSRRGDIAPGRLSGWLSSPWRLWESTAGCCRSSCR